ncbi:MAG: PIN domain-containing protein [Verrucomicrobiota bacterium]
MPVAVDTSVLIHAEKSGEFESLLPEGEGLYYIPVHAAAEFLVGAHLPKSAHLRERARSIYENKFKLLVDLFDENDAAQLALLISELRKSGQQMGFFDAAIAATAMARGDALLCLDDDFDRLKEKIDLLKP